MPIGFVALAANALVAFLPYRYRNDDANRLSVWLCSRNDVVAKLAVILAGAGAWAFGTPWLDIAVAAAIAVLGLTSTLRIPRATARRAAATLWSAAATGAPRIDPAQGLGEPGAPSSAHKRRILCALRSMP